MALVFESPDEELLQEQPDGTFIKARVVVELARRGDLRDRLRALKSEREYLQAVLSMPKPSKQELIELGKTVHPYYAERARAAQRLDAVSAEIERLRAVLKEG